VLVEDGDGGINDSSTTSNSESMHSSEPTSFGYSLIQYAYCSLGVTGWDGWDRTLQSLKK